MTQLASFQGVIRIILIILLVYYGMKLISRLLAPYLIKSLSKRAERQFEERFGNFRKPQEPDRKEGETSIDKMPENANSANQDVGEYVDYEEID